MPQRQFNVSFAKEDTRVSNQSKRPTKPLLVRDHSLGRDYVENLSLEEFSWEKPAQKFGAAGVSRQNSLAMNPLQHTNVNEPVHPSYLYERPSAGFRRSSSGNPPDTYPDSVAPSGPRTHLRRSSSSEHLSSGPDHRTNIYQSWSHGQQDEYVQQNSNAHSNWERPGPGPGPGPGPVSGLENGPMPPPPKPPHERYDAYQRPASRSTSNNSAYGSGIQPYDYKSHPQSSAPRSSYPPESFRRSLPHPQSSGVARRSSHSSHSSHSSQDRNLYSFGDTSFDNGRSSSNPPPQRSYSNTSQNHYQMNKRSSPSKQYPQSTVSPPPDGFNDPYAPKPYPYPTNPPNDAYYNDGYDPISNSTRNHHSSSSSSTSYSSHRRKHRYPSGGNGIKATGLARPSTVKRATSNQNEEAETKKETKLIKRPGLNRENSITAYRLKEAQRKKETGQLQGDDGYPVQQRPTKSVNRQHSLAGHKLTVDDTYLENPPSTTIFSEETDDTKEEPIEPLLFKIDAEELANLDDDIQDISHATKGIDLGNSPNSLKRPPTLNIRNRMTTTEFIDELVATTSTSPEELFGSLE